MGAVRIEMVPEALAVLEEIKSRALKSGREKTLLNGIRKKLDIITNKPGYGDHISQKLIPLDYVMKYKARNLYRVELPGFWRMIYKIRADSTSKDIVVEVLDVFDHDTYNKKFGYRPR